MGTNFYWADAYSQDYENGGQADSDSDVKVHIGKRSAAGSWCWDCGVTLCREGTHEVHNRGTRYDQCPTCGKTGGAALAGGTGGVELGFNETPRNQAGVGSCASFTWTMYSHKTRLHQMRAAGDQTKYVISEYGDLYTAAEFLDNELAAVTIEEQYAGNFS